MYSFLRRPAWLALHAVVLVVVVAFVSLGFWQLRRLEERRLTNSEIEQRLRLDPVPITEVVNPAEYTRVEVEGEYRALEEVLLRSQVYDGRPGFDVITPFYFSDERAVLVNRGWVPLEFDTPPVAAASPAPGRVKIIGVTRMGATGGTRETGEVARTWVARVEMDVLQGQVEGTLLPFYLELEGEGHAADQALPIPPEAVDLGEGPHLSYAIQWFSFAMVTTVGHAALIRSTGRKRGATGREAAMPPPPS
jgi:cytochrome oxidase assembly protein ShyY1